MDEELAGHPPAESFTRRGFVATSLGVGIALTTTPAMAQVTIRTDDAGLTAGDVTIPSPAGPIPAYRAMPDKGGVFPTILVVEEISGLQDYLKDVCRRLGKLGYFAVAPELFARQGGLAHAASQQQAMQMLGATADAAVMADLDAAAAWARASGKSDPARLGVTGFCLGGRVAWLYAEHNPALKAAVVWYGRVVGTTDELHPANPLDRVADIRCPVLGLFGGQDPSITAQSLERMKQAATAAGKKVEIVTYPDAGHAFHSDYRTSYQKKAAEDGWRRMQAWFKENGV